MTLFIAKRFGQTIMTLIILSVMIFGLARLTGDPTPLIVPAEATEADRDFFRRQYGLDRSLPEQYLIFVSNVLRGDFGVSFRYREPAIDVVARSVGPTIKLASIAMLFSILIGLPLGILAAVYREGPVDRLVRVYNAAGQSMPSFWLGMMLITFFAISLPIFPSSGYGTAAHYVLPVATLAIYTSSAIARLTRANMQEALASDAVHLQRVLGLSPWRIVLKHALRNASLPIVTFFGLQFGLLLGGAVVTERVFAWPGLGQTVVDAILTRDFPVIQAAVLMIALFFILINLAVDILCMILDPRVRL